MSLLSVERLDARHGLLQAVRNIDLAAGEGEIVALVGANGAGKTTLLRTIAGAHRPFAGRIVFDGRDVTPMRAHERVALGIALVPEGRRLFAGLTVEENLRVAGDAGRSGAWNIEVLLSTFPMLKARLKTPAGLLSGGEQQATAIGRAMMTNPRLLLLDEISLGLAPLAVDNLYRSLTTLFASGTTLIIVEQNLNRVLGVATRICCMLEGRIVLECDAKDATRERITNAYFGLRDETLQDSAAVIWVDQIIQGILLGGYYALIACGLSLMFGVMRIINLAHGDLAILGVFAVSLIAVQTGISPFYALAAAIPLMALLGWALQRWVLERSLRAGPLVPLLATFGLAIVIENLLFEGFGADTRSLAPEIGDLAFDSWMVAGQIYVGYLAVLVFAVAVVLLVGLQLFLKWTATGRAIRATAEDPDTAELVGVNSRAAYAIAAAIAVATTAIAGTFLAMRATFDPYSGPAQLIFAFEAVVIGGVGSLWGTLIGGIILGVAQSVGAQIGPRGFLLTGHIVFLLVLAARLFMSGIDWRAGFSRNLRSPGKGRPL